MILQLLQTFAITMGIGLSVNNTNFEHKERRNETQTVGFAINETYTQKGSTFTAPDDGQKSTTMKKWLLNKDGATTTNPNYSHPYLMISNTVYSFYWQYSNPAGYYEVRLYQIFKITNYYNSTVNFSIESSINTAGNFGNTTYNQRAIYRTSNDNVPIDIALNASTWGTVYQYTNQGQILDNTVGNVPNSQTYITQKLNNETIEGNKTRTYVFMVYRQENSSPMSSYGPTDFTMNGSVSIPTTPIEVIDIPSVIFNIMTLPFSFISQAFNLTIFPNTPYQINFSNLFITIISIFILLWLIRHIFK